MKIFAQYREKGMIPALLMFLCRLSISWKVESLSPGGRLPMKEKNVLLSAGRDKDNEIWIYCTRQNSKTVLSCTHSDNSLKLHGPGPL